MKKHMTRILALVLVLIIAVGTTAIAEEGSKSFTYWLPFIGGATAKQYISSYNESSVYIERENRTGVHIDFEHPSVGEEKEQFNLMIVSNILPDMVSDVDSYYVGGVLTAISDGLFVDVTDMIEEYAPNLCALMEMNPALKKELYSDDGIFMGFPMITIGSDQTGDSIMPGPCPPGAAP